MPEETDGPEEAELCCKQCHTFMTIEYGHEAPEHGLCWPCSSDMVTQQAEIIQKLRESNAHLIQIGSTSARLMSVRAQLAMADAMIVKLEEDLAAAKARMAQLLEAPPTMAPAAQEYRQMEMRLAELVKAGDDLILHGHKFGCLEQGNHPICVCGWREGPQVTAWTKARASHTLKVQSSHEPGYGTNIAKPK
jgi:hypothetical protein